tara:strand:- start:39 stop:416 length:378 start_codon:yes stop_codon:yes gene_type:complete
MTTKKERMYSQIDQHGQRLNNLFNTDLDNVALCKKLFRLENRALRCALDYCNGHIDHDLFEEASNILLEQVALILSTDESNIFINGDPRGYAIKFTTEFTNDNIKDMWRDMGGYGIVAPDFREVA